MTERPVRGCPDPALLAEFAEGFLDAEHHSDVVRHAANCSECAIVIGETIRFLGESEKQRPAWGWRRSAVAAALTAIAISLVLWRAGTSDPLAQVRDAAVVADNRHVEGNLHGFAWKPFNSIRSQKASGPELELRAAAEETSRLRGDHPATVHARGVAFLLLGDTPKAIANFVHAARSSPERAAYWNDLAVAYVAAGAASGDPYAYQQAVAAADRALALAPDLSSAAFNRGVALEHLRQRHSAGEAYRRALASAPRSAWTSEIRQRIEILEHIR